MTVSAVGQNDGSSRLNTIIKSTAAGTVAGYAMKYIWPVTEQEEDITPKTMVNYCRKLTNKTKVHEIKSRPKVLKKQVGDTFEWHSNMSKAEKRFVSMIESGDKNAFTKPNLKNIVDELGGENSLAGQEFRAIIREVNETSHQMVKRWAVAYKMMLKRIRPTVPFLVAGAGVGFFTGFTHNVMKCDYDA